MASPAALGADGAAPLTASDWKDVARAVAVARRAGLAAVSVRHITFHLSSLQVAVGNAHGNGSQAYAPPAVARGRGLRSAHLGPRWPRSSGRSAGASPAAPPPEPSTSPPPTPTSTCAAASHAEVVPTSAGAAAAPAEARRHRGWLRSAAYHHWRRSALRCAFQLLLACAHPSAPMALSCLKDADRCGVKRPPSPSSPPSAPCPSLSLPINVPSY